MIINLPQENARVNVDDEFDVQLESLLAGDPENGIEPESPIVVAGQTRIEFDDAYRIVNSEFHQLDQLFTVQDNLVNVIAVFETHKNKPEKLGGVLDLVNRGDGAAMALIGKDVEDELPEAKDYPVAVALESAGERVKKVIQNIIDAIKKILSSIGNLAKKVIQMFKGHRKSIISEQKRFKDTQYVVGLDSKVKDLHFRTRSFVKDDGSTASLEEYLDAEREQISKTIKSIVGHAEKLNDGEITDKNVQDIVDEFKQMSGETAKKESYTEIDKTTPKDLGIEGPRDVREILSSIIILFDDEKRMKKMFDDLQKALKSTIKDLEKANSDGEDGTKKAKDRLKFINELNKYLTEEMRKTGNIAMNTLKVIRVIKPTESQK